jgi:hypothetical protein
MIFRLTSPSSDVIRSQVSKKKHPHSHAPAVKQTAGAARSHGGRARAHATARQRRRSILAGVHRGRFPRAQVRPTYDSSMQQACVRHIDASGLRYTSMRRISVRATTRKSSSSRTVRQGGYPLVEGHNVTDTASPKPCIGKVRRMAPEHEWCTLSWLVCLVLCAHCTAVWVGRAGSHRRTEPRASTNPPGERPLRKPGGSSLRSSPASNPP